MAGITDNAEVRPIPADGRLTLWLASRSPRRRKLLLEHGFDTTQVVESGIDDGDLTQGDVGIFHWATALAYLKAKAAAVRLSGEGATGLVLGADTLVEKDGQSIGQPRDVDDARRIIQALNDTDHEVVTGVALIDLASGERILFVDAASVEVGHISDESIEAYLTTGAWRGKAGAYNLEERIEAGWPIEYEGDPATIMGLPMVRLTELLARRWGMHPSSSSTSSTTMVERCCDDG